MSATEEHPAQTAQALEPFSKAAHLMEGWSNDDAVTLFATNDCGEGECALVTFSVSDFRRARTALEALNPAGSVPVGGDTREIAAQAILARIRKVRDGYADQAKFADVEPASYFREFIRRLDEAVKPSTRAAWGGNTPSPAVPPQPVKDGQAEPVGEELARRFHEAYERLAPSFGYETRPETRAFDPDSANGRLMIAVCAALGHAAPVTEEVEKLRRELHAWMEPVDNTGDYVHPLWKRVHEAERERDQANSAWRVCNDARNASRARMEAALARATAAQTARDDLQARVEAADVQLCQAFSYGDSATHADFRIAIRAARSALLPSSTPAEAGQEQSRVEALEEALRPFALDECILQAWEDDDAICAFPTEDGFRLELTAGDLRAARAALENRPGSKTEAGA